MILKIMFFFFKPENVTKCYLKKISIMKTYLINEIAGSI